MNFSPTISYLMGVLRPNTRASRAHTTASSTRRWVWRGLAAALVAASIGGVTLTRRHAPTAATTSAAPAPLSAQAITSELQQAEAHYEKAIAGLEQIAKAEGGVLDPVTSSTLEKNLAVIDRAIGESRAAVQAQPASEPAQASLLENFRAKISVLQDTVALINEMRKGDEAGAARIVSDLEQKGN